MTLFSSLWSEANGTNTPLFGDLWAGVSDTGVEALEPLFANGEQGGYWPADPAYAYEDSAGTTAASVNGVVGLRYDRSSGSVAAARRNLLNNTENFTLNWNAGTSYVADSIIAPNGTLTADKCIETEGTSEHYSEQVILTHTNQTYTSSVYIKAFTGTGFIISAVAVGSSVAVSNAFFTISNSVISASYFTGLILAQSATAVGDGWYRCAVTYTLNGTVTFHTMRIYPARFGVVSGDTNLGIYLWGQQLDVGASVTTYQKIITGDADCLPGNHAIQQTTANKPYLRRTPTTNKPWYDSNTATGALNVTFASALGSACTIATVTPEGVSILENQTVGTTYNICPPYGYNSDVLIINRALTAVEKALVTRNFNRNKPAYGSLVNAIPQIRGYSTNNEMQIDFGSKTSLSQYWRYGGTYLTSFPMIDTSNVTSFSQAWYGCDKLTSFPLIDTSQGVSFSLSWIYCSNLTSFPLIDTSQGTDFSLAWYWCSKLTSFPSLNISKGTNFSQGWLGCSLLANFPAGMFDNWIGVPISSVFNNTWSICTALTETSVQNIIVSIAASGKSAPAGTGTQLHITLDGAPALATIQANSTIMDAVTTLKSRNWIPTYKGTAL